MCRAHFRRESSVETDQRPYYWFEQTGTGQAVWVTEGPPDLDLYGVREAVLDNPSNVPAPDAGENVCIADDEDEAHSRAINWMADYIDDLEETESEASTNQDADDLPDLRPSSGSSSEDSSDDTTGVSAGSGEDTTQESGDAVGKASQYF